MQEALDAFKGTKEEERLMICNADLALARGDVDRVTLGNFYLRTYVRT